MKATKGFKGQPIATMPVRPVSQFDDYSNESSQLLEEALKKKRQKIAMTRLRIPPETDKEV